MQCMNEDLAADLPVGEGRSDPNQTPFLPKPDRPSLFELPTIDFNFDLFGGIIAKMRSACRCLCCIICVVGGLYMYTKIA